MFDVAPDILAGKGLQVIADRDPLVELAKRRQRQEPAELRLAQEDDLDELSLIPFISGSISIISGSGSNSSLDF